MTLLQRMEREKGGLVAMIVLVISAFVVTFVRGHYGAGAITLLVILGMVYLVANVWAAFYLTPDTPFRWITAVYFAGTLSLATAINFVAMKEQDFSMTWLIVLPVVSQSLDISPHPKFWNGVVSVLALLTFVWPTTQIFGFAVALETAFFLVPAILFVNVFTRMAQQERHMREKMERLAVELNEANQKLRVYATQIEELATTKERNRLAREIHDSLGHYLTVIHVQIEAAQAVLDVDRGKGLDALRKAQQLAQEGLGEVRRSVKALRESPLDNHSLGEVIGELVETCRAAGLAAAWQITGIAYPLAREVQMTLYRAAQEGLTNVRKHALASRVDVALDYGLDRVQLMIVDNGIGAAAATHNGFGLIGIQERVALLGGQVQMKTAPTQGFWLTIEIPVQDGVKGDA
ncbi:MAG: sensor histidine kinase [Candidatus Promineifilaceae bacterium]